MIGTFDQLLADRRTDLGYLFGEGDPPVIKARRSPMPPRAMYQRADARQPGDRGAYPAGKLAAWLDGRYPRAMYQPGGHAVTGVLVALLPEATVTLLAVVVVVLLTRRRREPVPGPESLEFTAADWQQIAADLDSGTTHWADVFPELTCAGRQDAAIEMALERAAEARR